MLWLQERGAGSLYLDVGVPTAVLTLSLPPLSTSTELELQGGLCSPVCKCVCVCGREQEMSWYFLINLEYPPQGST